jgi:glucose/arabinose dehydrogenase
MKWLSLAAGTLLIAGSATGDQSAFSDFRVAMAADGALLVSDDVSNSIWRVSYGK